MSSESKRRRVDPPPTARTVRLALASARSSANPAASAAKALAPHSTAVRPRELGAAALAALAPECVNEAQTVAELLFVRALPSARLNERGHLIAAMVRLAVEQSGNAAARAALDALLTPLPRVLSPPSPAYTPAYYLFVLPSDANQRLAGRRLHPAADSLLQLVRLRQQAMRTRIAADSARAQPCALLPFPWTLNMQRMRGEVFPEPSAIAHVHTRFGRMLVASYRHALDGGASFAMVIVLARSSPTVDDKAASRRGAGSRRDLLWRAAIAERARLLAICDSVREWQDKELSEFDAAAAFAELDADEHVDSLGGNASAFGFASHRADQRSSMSQKVDDEVEEELRAVQSGGQLPFDRNEPSPEPDDGMDETDVDGFFADDNELPNALLAGTPKTPFQEQTPQQAEVVQTPPETARLRRSQLVLNDLPLQQNSNLGDSSAQTKQTDLTSYQLLKTSLGGWISLIDTSTALAQQDVFTLRDLLEQMCTPLGIGGASHGMRMMWLLCEVLVHKEAEVISDVLGDAYLCRFLKSLTETVYEKRSTLYALKRREDAHFSLIELAGFAATVMRVIQIATPTRLGLKDAKQIARAQKSVEFATRLMETSLPMRQFADQISSFHYERISSLRLDDLSPGDTLLLSAFSSLQSHHAASFIEKQLAAQPGHAIDSSTLALLSVRTRARLLSAINAKISKRQGMLPSELETYARLIYLTASEAKNFTGRSCGLMNTLCFGPDPHNKHSHMSAIESQHLRQCVEFLVARLLVYFARQSEVGSILWLVVTSITRRLTHETDPPPRPVNASGAAIAQTSANLRTAAMAPPPARSRSLDELRLVAPSRDGKLGLALATHRAYVHTAHAAALVEQPLAIITPIERIGHSTRAALLASLRDFEFYRPLADTSRLGGIHMNQAKVASSLGFKVEGPYGNHGLEEPVRAYPPEQVPRTTITQVYQTVTIEDVNAEIKRWDDNGLKWDLSDAEQRFRAMLRDADDAKRKCFIPVLLSKDVASPLSEPEIIKAQRAFLGALPALDWDRLAFEAVHFVLDAHASVQAARQRGSDADSVKALQIAVSLLCRYEALLPIEYIVAALGTRDLTDSFANQVLQAILVGDDRTTFRDSRLLFIAQKADASFAAPAGASNDGLAARRDAESPHAWWHYTDYAIRMKEVTFMPGVMFEHDAIRYAPMLEATLRRWAMARDWSRLSECLQRGGAQLLRYHALQTGVSHALVLAAAEGKAPLSTIVRCARTSLLPKNVYTHAGCARVLRAGGSVTDAGLDEQLPELDAEYARTLLARCAPLCDIHNPIELDNCVAPGSARRFGVASAGEARDQSDLPRACSLKPGADAFGRTGVDVLLVERIDELQEAPAESVAASAVDADDDLRRDVPSASELAHEPLPLRAFEWPGTAIASAAMGSALEIVLSGRNLSSAELGQMLATACLDVSSDRVGAVAYGGVVGGLLPFSIGVEFASSCLRIFFEACQQFQTRKDREILMHDCAQISFDEAVSYRFQYEGDSHPNGAARRGLHAKAALHTLLRHAASYKLVSSVIANATQVAQQHCDAMTPLGVWSLVVAVIPFAGRSTSAALFDFVVAVAEALVGCDKHAVRSSASRTRDVTLLDQDEECIEFCLNALHHNAVIRDRRMKSSQSVEDMNAVQRMTLATRPSMSRQERAHEAVLLQKCVQRLQAISSEALSVGTQHRLQALTMAYDSLLGLFATSGALETANAIDTFE